MTTFIQHCNAVLRRLNEVEISEASFPTVRGIQALVKDAVRASLADINQSEFFWPFNAASGQITLQPGVIEYTWPQDLKRPEWDSFYVVADPSIQATHQDLEVIDRDLWYRSYRRTDLEAGVAGSGIPTRIFPSHGWGFGVSPSPDKEYRVRYRYFLNYTPLENADDVTRLPESFNTTLVEGAMYHMYLFKENVESAQLSKARFTEKLRDLQKLYTPAVDKVYDLRVPDNPLVMTGVEAFNA